MKRTEVLEKVRRNWWNFKYVDEIYIKDKEIVLSAVK